MEVSKRQQRRSNFSHQTARGNPEGDSIIKKQRYKVGGPQADYDSTADYGVSPVKRRKQHGYENYHSTNKKGHYGQSYLESEVSTLDITDTPDSLSQISAIAPVSDISNIQPSFARSRHSKMAADTTWENAVSHARGEPDGAEKSFHKKKSKVSIKEQLETVPEEDSLHSKGSSGGGSMRQVEGSPGIQKPPPTAIERKKSVKGQLRKAASVLKKARSKSKLPENKVGVKRKLDATLADETMTTKPDMKELNKKERKHVRKALKTNFEQIQRSKKIWEELRSCKMGLKRKKVLKKTAKRIKHQSVKKFVWVKFTEIGIYWPVQVISEDLMNNRIEIFIKSDDAQTAGVSEGPVQFAINRSCRPATEIEVLKKKGRVKTLTVFIEDVAWALSLSDSKDYQDLLREESTTTTVNAGPSCTFIDNSSDIIDSTAITDRFIDASSFTINPASEDMRDESTVGIDFAATFDTLIDDSYALPKNTASSDKFIDGCTTLANKPAPGDNFIDGSTTPVNKPVPGDNFIDDSTSPVNKSAPGDNFIDGSTTPVNKPAPGDNFIDGSTTPVNKPAPGDNFIDGSTTPVNKPALGDNFIDGSTSPVNKSAQGDNFIDGSTSPVNISAPVDNFIDGSTSPVNKPAPVNNFIDGITSPLNKPAPVDNFIDGITTPVNKPAPGDNFIDGSTSPVNKPAPGDNFIDGSTTPVNKPAPGDNFIDGSTTPVNKPAPGDNFIDGSTSPVNKPAPGDNFIDGSTSPVNKPAPVNNFIDGITTPVNKSAPGDNFLGGNTTQEDRPAPHTTPANKPASEDNLVDGSTTPLNKPAPGDNFIVGSSTQVNKPAPVNNFIDGLSTQSNKQAAGDNDIDVSPTPANKPAPGDNLTDGNSTPVNKPALENDFIDGRAIPANKQALGDNFIDDNTSLVNKLVPEDKFIDGRTTPASKPSLVDNVIHVDASTTTILPAPAEMFIGDSTITSDNASTSATIKGDSTVSIDNAATADMFLDYIGSIADMLIEENTAPDDSAAPSVTLNDDRKTPRVMFICDSTTPSGRAPSVDTLINKSTIPTYTAVPLEKYTDDCDVHTDKEIQSEMFLEDSTTPTDIASSADKTKNDSTAPSSKKVSAGKFIDYVAAQTDRASHAGILVEDQTTSDDVFIDNFTSNRMMNSEVTFSEEEDNEDCHLVEVHVTDYISDSEYESDTIVIRYPELSSDKFKVNRCKTDTSVQINENQNSQNLICKNDKSDRDKKSLKNENQTDSLEIYHKYDKSSDKQQVLNLEDDDDDIYAEYVEEDEILRDAKKPGIYIRKVLSSSTTKCGKAKKSSRVYNSYHSCIYCDRLVSNYAQHMKRKHLNKPQIKATFEVEDKLKRKKMITLLCAEMDNAHNLKTKQNEKGEILLFRRPKDQFDFDLFGPCPACFLWISKKILSRHQLICIADSREKLTFSELITRSDIIADRIQDIASPALVNEVFKNMLMDDIGNLARKDHLIVRLGNMWMEKNIGNRLKRGKYTSQIMRMVARLLQNLKKETNTDYCLSDYLKPCFFDEVAKATLLTAGQDAEDTELLESPSNAIKLGHDLKRVANIKIGLAIMAKDRQSEEEGQGFLRTLNVFWGTRVTKLARTTLVERQFNKRQVLPDTDDIQKLNEYLNTQLSMVNAEEFSSENYVHIAKLVCSKLLQYNRRRPGEIEAITLADYGARMTGASETAVFAGELTKFERKLLETQEVLTTRGKGHRGVPILIPEEAKIGMAFIANRHVRESNGVNNTYLFATAESYRSVIRVYDCLAEQCQNASLKYPERITATTLRKYMATITQVLDLKPHQLEWVMRHMGHSLDVHKIYYRSTSDVIERTQIAKILLLQDSGRMENFYNKSLDDIQLSEVFKLTATKFRFNVKKERKLELCNELYDMVKEKMKEFCFAHDTARVIQCLIQYGTPEHREKVFEELKDEIPTMSKSKYAKFLVKKLLMYGTKHHRSAVYKSFHGHVRQLIRHKVAADVVEYAYNEFANAHQRLSMLEDFYGPSFCLFKTPDIKCLGQIMLSQPDKRDMILRNMREALLPLIDKNILVHSMVHKVFMEYFTYADGKMKAEMIEALRESVIHMLHTRDGARVAMQCIWHGTAKDRKTIIKSFKGNVVKICQEEYGHLVMLSIFDCVDDTKIVKAALLEEMMKSLNDVAQNQYGRKVLLYLLSPRDSHHFCPDIVRVLQEGDASLTSKKDKSVRYQELLGAVSDQLLQYIVDNVATLVVNNNMLVLIVAIITHAPGDPTAAMEAVASIAAEPFVVGNTEGGLHIVENPAGHMTLKWLIQNDKQRIKTGQKVLFSEVLLKKLPEGALKSWAACNRGCFILVCLLDLEHAEITKLVLAQLMKGVRHSLKKMTFKGAQILAQKLDEAKSAV